MNNNSKFKTWGKFLSITLALALVILSTLTMTKAPANADTETTILTSPFTKAIEEVHPSVVGVKNYGMYQSSSSPFSNFPGFGFGQWNNPQPSEPTETLIGSGSGVVIDDGYVLTNWHVVEDSTRLEVVIGEEIYPAVLMGFDETKDIAVLKAEKLLVKPAPLGNSDSLRVGDWAIVIGNPIGFSGTTTVGIISGLDREISNETKDVYGLRTDEVNLMIQTDAAINSGNSGGGLFNTAGELMGIPTLTYSGTSYSGRIIEGIGMAIPINEAKQLIDDVVSGKTNIQDNSPTSSTNNLTTDSKPRIGVTVANLNPSNYAVLRGILPQGAYISTVEPASPAEKAGIQVGDIVVEIDGTIITNTTEMIDALSTKAVGDKAKIKLYRVEGLDALEQNEEIPSGEYIDLEVELSMLDNAIQ